jgi:hypothetical protein
LQGCFFLKHAINKEIKTLENNDKLSRTTKQAETREAPLAAGDLAGAKALRNFIILEETPEMWRQIQSMEDEHDQGVTSVQIPADGDLTNPNCKTCEFWITLDQPEAIREALISGTNSILARHREKSHGKQTLHTLINFLKATSHSLITKSMRFPNYSWNNSNAQLSLTPSPQLSLRRSGWES